jgi:hypothetical protein
LSDYDWGAQAEPKELMAELERTHLADGSALLEAAATDSDRGTPEPRQALDVRGDGPVRFYLRLNGVGPVRFSLHLNLTCV